MEAYLFKLEIGNHIGAGRHFNIIADTLEEAWGVLFSIATPHQDYKRMTYWNVEYLGKGKLIEHGV